MGKTAFIFPGQGSQYVGMGDDLNKQSVVAQEIFTTADKILGFSLSSILFGGPEEELKQTKNTQPAIFLHSVILTQLLPDLKADMAAGHSLGEYSALTFAGALSFEDGLRLVRLRGELMQRAGEQQKGTMAAIVGLEPSVLETVCKEASVSGVVVPANFNSPGQIVVSGSVEGVRKAMELSKARGAKLAKELVVSGAFHSPLMQSAADEFYKALEQTKINDATIPVYANVTAKPVQRAEEIRNLLLKQLTQPVRWEESVRTMISDGATRFVEIGPGKVLQGLVKRTKDNVEVTGMDKWQDLQTVKM